MSTISTALVSNSLPLPESAGMSHPMTAAKGGQSAQKAAQDFESLFASMLIKEMRQSLEPGSMFGEDSADIYGGLFDRFMGEHIGKAGGLGIARVMREAIERMQQAANPQAKAPADQPTETLPIAGPQLNEI